MKKFEVVLITTSRQTKVVNAISEDVALVIAHCEDWNENEEVLDTEIEIREIKD